MLDPAEQWLRDHDPDYAESRKAWRHLEDGCPPQEIPWGLEEDFDILLNAGYKHVEPIEERACEECAKTFVPREVKQRFCVPACRWRNQKRRQRMSASS